MNLFDYEDTDFKKPKYRRIENLIFDKVDLEADIPEFKPKQNLPKVEKVRIIGNKGGNSKSLF